MSTEQNTDKIMSLEDENKIYLKMFFDAMYSGKVQKFREILTEWQSKHSADDDMILSILMLTFEELQLQNIALTEEMEIVFLYELIRIRFAFFYASEQNVNEEINLQRIKKRVRLVVVCINWLKIAYTNTEKIDDEFVYVVKLVAQNIHILKQRLKSTYDRLPWEELEFCLVSYISYFIKRSDLGVLSNLILNKKKILKYLDVFGRELKEEKNLENVEGIDKLAYLPKLSRDKVAANIIRFYPQFEELYNDHQLIRDLHSLTKMHDYTKLAIGANPATRDGALTLIRVLQVIGEYLKNDLESPKLSVCTSDLLLLSISDDTRRTILDLRNSLSDAQSLYERIDIDVCSNHRFSTNATKDIKILNDVIADMLVDNKIKILVKSLENILNNECDREVKDAAELLVKVDFNSIILMAPKISKSQKFINLIVELRKLIIDASEYEVRLFQELFAIISGESIPSSVNTVASFTKAFYLLKREACLPTVDHSSAIQNFKLVIPEVINDISPMDEMFSNKILNQIAAEIMKVIHTALSRMTSIDIGKKIILEIFVIVQSQTGNHKYIEQLRENDFFIPVHKTHKKWKTHIPTNEEINELLSFKLCELNNILRDNALSGDNFIESISSYKKNKKLQAVIEILLLDILSITKLNGNNLERDLIIFEFMSFLLSGGPWLDYLARGNPLIEVSISDPSIPIILIAERLISVNVPERKKRFRKTVLDESPNLFILYSQRLDSVILQNKMFDDLEQGDVDSFKSHMINGVEIRGRSIDLSTASHFAAKGSRLDRIENILTEPLQLEFDVRDVNGQTPLHVAAAQGNKNAVTYLVKNKNIPVDILDNYKQTPLLIAAANGYNDVTEFLLSRKARTDVSNIFNFTPLKIAIRNNHIDVVRTLLKVEPNVFVDNSESIFMCLYLAAKFGRAEIVNFILVSISDPTKGVIRDTMPDGAVIILLNVAVMYGHIDALNALLNGFSNEETKQSCIPLYHSIRLGYEDMTMILLNRGIDINSTNKIPDSEWEGNQGLSALNEFNSITSILNVALIHDRLKMFYLLIERGANIFGLDNKNWSHLSYAVYYDRREAAEYLIKRGLDVNHKNDNNMTPLQLAALKGHKDIVELLLSNKADISCRDKFGDTILHRSSLEGDVEIINLLIQHKVELNSENNSALTPLQHAVRHGHEAAVAALITSKAEVNVKDKCGWTPLHAAAGKGYKNIVCLLLENGANIDAESHLGNTPLDEAVQGGYIEIVKILIANGADVNVKRSADSLLFDAVKHNYKDVLETLIEYGTSVKAVSNKLLALAVFAGSTSTLQFLLNRTDIDLNKSDIGELLYKAIVRGHKEIVNILIRWGANVNAKFSNECTPLCVAVQAKHEEITELLIRNGADVNVAKPDHTPLDISVGLGNIGITEILLNNKADANVVCCNFTSTQTAVLLDDLRTLRMLLQYKTVNIKVKNLRHFPLLHIAASQNHLKIIKYLVHEGFDINGTNETGEKPIHIAASHGHKETVEFFLNKGLSIHSACDHLRMFTLLHYAVKSGGAELVRYLIEQGSDVNAKTKRGSTPMHIAIERGFHEIVEILLQNNPNLNAADNQGQTPLHLAAALSHFIIAKILLCHGAVYNAVTSIGKTPLDISTDESIITLLQFIDETFKKVRGGDIQIDDYLNAIEDSDTLKAVTTARNTENLTLAQEYMKCPKPKQFISKILVRDQLIQEDPLVFNEADNHNELASEVAGNDKVTLTQIEEVDDTLDSNNTEPKEIDIANEIRMFTMNMFSSMIIFCNNILKQAETDHEGKQNAETDMDKAEAIIELLLIAKELSKMKLYQEALRIFQGLLEFHKRFFSRDHKNILNIQYRIGNILYKQGQYIEALKYYSEHFEHRNSIYGTTDEVCHIVENMMLIKYKAESHIRDIQPSMRLLEADGDNDEMTLLYAVKNGLVEAVKNLLNNFDDINKAKDEDKILLHIAISKGHLHIVSLLLQHKRRVKLMNIINSNILSNRTLPLRVGAISGFLDIIKSELGRRENEPAPDFLEITEIFKNIEMANRFVISGLRSLQLDGFLDVMCTRNEQGNTLLQAALANNRVDIVIQLLEILEDLGRTLETQSTAADEDVQLTNHNVLAEFENQLF